MAQAAGMGKDEKYELALSSSFTLKILIHGKAGALQVLGIYSLLSWFLELKIGIELSGLLSGQHTS